MQKNLLILVAIVIFLIGAGVAYTKLMVVHPVLTKYLQSTPAPSSVPSAHASLLDKLTPQSIGSVWTVAQTTTNGSYTGSQRTTTISSQTASPDHFEDVALITSLGFTPSTALEADGPGSSQWGYQRTVNGEVQVLVYGFKTQPSSNDPNQPVSFDCPCQSTLSVFLSHTDADVAVAPSPAAAGSTTLANPASVNCVKVGGTVQIQTLGNGAQYGLCQFEDNMACEEWALINGHCPVGGVKTTGYDNQQQMYCAWLGGQTLAEPNASCTLPGGKVCSVDALYNGTCSATSS